MFDVSVQGKKVLRRFDVAREAARLSSPKSGGARRAVVRTFRGVEVRDAVEIELRRSRDGVGRPPVLSGIEVLDDALAEEMSRATR